MTMIAVTCINRNIVECKDHHDFRITHQEHCINRNIVECKERYEAISQCQVGY